MFRKLLFLLLLVPMTSWAQFNTDRLVMIGRSALYYEDYVLSIQYFNQAITAKPYLFYLEESLCGGHLRAEGLVQDSAEELYGRDSRL